MMKKIIHKPNFFIVGASKCGTTALSYYLASHPNIFFSPVKEPHYFATDMKYRTVRRFNDYIKLFENANPNLHYAIGEGSTTYLFSKVAIENIITFSSAAKIIVMIRNPVDMVVSLYFQHLGEDGFENLRSFEEAWEAEKKRKLGKNIPFTCPDPQLLFYSEWGKLGSQLQRVFNYVPRDQILVIIFDDFINDTRSVYCNVLSFLNLQDDGRTTFPPRRERRMVRNFFYHRLLAFLTRLWMPARSILTRGRGFGLYERYFYWNSRLIKPTISSGVKRELTSFYKNEIQLLEEILHRDLSNWLSVS